MPLNRAEDRVLVHGRIAIAQWRETPQHAPRDPSASTSMSTSHLVQDTLFKEECC